MKVIKNIVYITKYAFKYSAKYVFVSLLTLFLNLGNSVFSMYFLKIAFDAGSQIITLDTFIKYLAYYMCYEAIVYTVNICAQTLVTPQESIKLKQGIQCEIFEKVKLVNLLKYDDPGFYNEYVLAIQNADGKVLIVFNTLLGLLSSILSVGAIITVMSTINFKILAIVVIISLIDLCLSTLEAKNSYSCSVEGILPSRVVSYVSRIFYIKDFAAELKVSHISNPLISLFGSNVAKLKDISLKYGKKNAKLMILQNTIQLLYTVVVLYFLTISMIYSKITAGEFAVVFNGSAQLATSLLSVFHCIPEIVKQSLFIEHFKGFMECEANESAECNGTIGMKKFHDMVFENVSFQYCNGKQTLNDINFSINRGEKIAFVGLNGAGKSTLIKLILRLYLPTTGSIKINGLINKQYSNDCIIEKFGVVFQDFKLFSIPIVDNVLQGSSSDDAAEENESVVLSSLEQVGLLDTIEFSQKGIHNMLTTELSSQGINLSGGEMQKLAVSRILSHNYEFVVLDEPSSSMDVESEDNIISTIFKKYKDETIVMISHKLSNIRLCDKIYFIQRGEIIESGSHFELMNLGGEYSKLYINQTNGL